MLTPVPGQIAFVSDESGRGQIYLMNSDGSDIHPLMIDGNDQRDPAWSPDGSRIAFTRSIRTQKNDLPPGTETVSSFAGAEIIIMDADGSNPVNLSESLNEQGLAAFTPAWSPDGKSIAFEAAQTQLLEDPFAGWNIYVADVNGSGKLRKLTNWEAGTGVGCFGAEWLPDGRRILAYCRSLMQAGVVLFDLRDPNFGEIMFEGQDAHLYDASHSGKLAFSEGAYIMINWGANFSETAMINEQLPQPSHQKHGGIDALAWSPTADQLAIRAFDELFVTNQDGSQMDQLVSGLPSARPADLGWSSDGSQILFTATLDGNQEIMLSAPGQKGAIRLTFSEANESQAVWKP